MNKPMKQLEFERKLELERDKERYRCAKALYYKQEDLDGVKIKRIYFEEELIPVVQLLKYENPNDTDEEIKEKLLSWLNEYYPSYFKTQCCIQYLNVHKTEWIRRYGYYKVRTYYDNDQRQYRIDRDKSITIEQFIDDICKWSAFDDYVEEPTDEEMEKEQFEEVQHRKWHGKNRKTCKDCGAWFTYTSNRQTRCPECAERIKREKSRERKRRQRGKSSEN